MTDEHSAIATRHRRHTAAILAIVPSIALAGASIWWTIAGSRGGGLWPPRPQTLAEAAAAGDVGEVVWQIQTGADPNVRTPVRSDLLLQSNATLNPLEAAVWMRDGDLARQLRRSGAPVDGAAAPPGRITAAALMGAPARLSPLEAAVWTREVDMLSLLLDHGAVADPQTTATLRCLNMARGGDTRVDALFPLPETSSGDACNTALLAR